jgi:hypothetical protein
MAVITAYITPRSPHANANKMVAVIHTSFIFLLMIEQVSWQILTIPLENQKMSDKFTSLLFFYPFSNRQEG